MRLFTQTATILLALLAVLIITSTPISTYEAPILAFIIIVSVIFTAIRQRSKPGEEIFAGSNKEVFAVVLGVILAIFLTGGLTSNLYFLLYFLVFGLVFLFEPLTVFVLAVGIIVVFLPSIQDGDLLANSVKIASVVFLSPISYFFGREFQKREKLKEDVADKTGQIIEDTEALLLEIDDDSERAELQDIEKRAKELHREAEKD